MDPSPDTTRADDGAAGFSGGYGAAALTAVVVHGTMAAGLVFGRWDAGASVLGVLLDSLVAYALWLAVYLRLRPSGKGVTELLAKTFVGLSLGVWGFIGMFRAITVKDTALLAFNAALLDGLSALGDADDGAVVIIVIVAALLLIASLYFLGKIVVLMKLVDLAWLAGGIAIFRVIEVLRYLHRNRTSTFTEKVGDAEDHLAELCLHVFVKGWAGALLMFFLVDTPVPLVWVYLAWSFAYDVLLRRLLWLKVGRGVRENVLARAASRHTEREPRPTRAARREAKRQRKAA